MPSKSCSGVTVNAFMPLSDSTKTKQTIPFVVKFSIILLTRIFYCCNYKAIKCKKKEKEERKKKPFQFQER